MYKDKVDWQELTYIIHKLNKGELKTKTLHQRIYRCKDSRLKLTYKIALVFYKERREGLYNEDRV